MLEKFSGLRKKLEERLGEIPQTIESSVDNSITSTISTSTGLFQALLTAVTNKLESYGNKLIRSLESKTAEHQDCPTDKKEVQRTEIQLVLPF